MCVVAAPAMAAAPVLEPSMLLMLAPPVVLRFIGGGLDVCVCVGEKPNQLLFLSPPAPSWALLLVAVCEVVGVWVAPAVCCCCLPAAGD